MNRQQLVEQVAEKAGVSRREADDLLNAVLDGIVASLTRGEKVTLTGFGTFNVRQRPERMGRNPQTGEQIRIAARNVPSFSAGKELKAAVNPPR